MREQKATAFLGEEKKPLVVMPPATGARSRGLAILVICCGLLLASFAIGALWMENGGKEWLQVHMILPFFSQDSKQNDSDQKEESPPIGNEGSLGNTEQESTLIPEGAIAVVERDLSNRLLGTSYLHNETVYTPDVEQLRLQALERMPVGTEPLVLILHTHTSESYLPADCRYIEGTLGDAIYSKQAEQGIVEVGRVLCQALIEQGIPSIHCTVAHDAPTMSGCYRRSYESIQYYLSLYPSIRYVIDLHRDSVLAADGSYVRSVSESAEGRIAQVMAVVGTDGNGTVYPSWQENLALALQLRDRLNQKQDGVCRPVSVRNASYNQELSRYSLLLEIGTGANSLEEAKRAALLVGECLAGLIQP